MSSNKKAERQSLDFYLQLNYPITMYPEEGGGFTVEIVDLPGCLSQGETVEEAFEMIEEARELWIETAYEEDIPIPMPSTEASYSGKTLLRMPKYLHEKLAISAKKEEVSLNQYIVSLLSERSAYLMLKDIQHQLIEEIKEEYRNQENDRYSAALEKEYAESVKAGN